MMLAIRCRVVEQQHLIRSEYQKLMIVLLWEINHNGTIQIRWTSIKPAPDALLEMISCNCKAVRSCSSNRCQCFSHQLKSSEARGYRNCFNEYQEEDDDDDDILDDDSDSFDEFDSEESDGNTE